MSEQQELVKRKAKLELDINDLQSEMDGDQNAKVRRLTQFDEGSSRDHDMFYPVTLPCLTLVASESPEYHFCI